ncbi:unnamed protein product, partial [Anisakis simplex]|uniref:MT0933-like antitoxin protein n=1 Tax=Anisakis simplex TaxID=6269 RepID=A0A0M3JMJ9_ANISI
MADLDQQRTKDRLDSESKGAEVVQKRVEADKLGKSNGSESSSQVDDQGRAVSSDIHGEGGLE